MHMHHRPGAIWRERRQHSCRCECNRYVHVHQIINSFARCWAGGSLAVPAFEHLERGNQAVTDLWLEFRPESRPAMYDAHGRPTAITEPIICISLLVNHIWCAAEHFYLRFLALACFWYLRVCSFWRLMAQFFMRFHCTKSVKRIWNLFEHFFVWSLHKKSFVRDVHICCSGNGQDQNNKSDSHQFAPIIQGLCKFSTIIHFWAVFFVDIFSTYYNLLI